MTAECVLDPVGWREMSMLRFRREVRAWLGSLSRDDPFNMGRAFDRCETYAPHFYLDTWPARGNCRASGLDRKHRCRRSKYSPARGWIRAECGGSNDCRILFGVCRGAP